MTWCCLICLRLRATELPKALFHVELALASKRLCRYSVRTCELCHTCCCVVPLATSSLAATKVLQLEARLPQVLEKIAASKKDVALVAPLLSPINKRGRR